MNEPKKEKIQCYNGRDHVHFVEGEGVKDADGHIYCTKECMDYWWGCLSDEYEAGQTY